jgi:hypothetical protein
MTHDTMNRRADHCCFLTASDAKLYVIYQAGIAVRQAERGDQELHNLCRRAVPSAEMCDRCGLARASARHGDHRLERLGYG